jgi:hypothetical protein
MNLSKKLGLIACSFVIAGGVRGAFGQAQPPQNSNANSGNNQSNQQPAQQAPPPSQYDVEQELKTLMADLDDSSFDEARLPKLIQKAFTDFRTVSQAMDPDQANDWRRSTMEQYIPVMQRNQAKIQKAMQTAFLLDLQEPLGASDDEFNAILPALEKVADAQRESQGGFARFRRQFGGPPGAPGNTQPPGQQVSPVDQASQDLQTALDDTNSSDDLIKNKLQILRDAKAKATQDLTVARDNLRSILTIRQEAVLVERGMLD